MKIYEKANIKSIIDKATPAPRFELTPQQVDKLKDYSSILLGVLSAVGMISLAVVAPNALRALKIFEGKTGKRSTHRDRQSRVYKAFYYLKRHGDIRMESDGNQIQIILTQKGEAKLKKLHNAITSIPKPKGKSWDGKFWQVAADIPVRYRKGADALRNKLKGLGFYPLQRTLWFYPYDPRNEIESLAKEFKVARFVTLMKIERLDNADKKVLEEYFRSTVQF